MGLTALFAAAIPLLNRKELPMMNLPAVNETMKSLRAELLAIEFSRSAAAAMLKVAAKSDAAA